MFHNVPGEKDLSSPDAVITADMDVVTVSLGHVGEEELLV